ncbi:MAG: hypothetical protein HZB23_08685, partial [Deltaproteobacteria bacterium]|nr:hypothetical protein [Deltaproteobacteria bacterium]
GAIDAEGNVNIMGVTAVDETGGIASDGAVSITVGGGAATLTGNVYGDLGVTVTADSVNATGSLNAEAGSVFVWADNGAATLAAVTAGIDVTVVSQTDAVTLNGLVTAGDDVTVGASTALDENGGIIAGDAVTLTSALSTVTVDGAIEAGGIVTTVAQTGLDVNNDITGDGGVLLTSNTGDVAVDGDIRAFTEGVITIAATTGNINIGGAAASSLTTDNGLITLTSGNPGTVILGGTTNVVSTGIGGLDVNAGTGFNSLAGGQVNVGGTVAINVTDGAATLSGNVYGDMGVTVTADSVNATGSLNAEAGNVNVMADNGAVALAAVNAGFDVMVGASDTATLNGLITAGDDVTVNAQNAVNELGGIAADGEVSLNSATSTVAVTGAIDAEGNVGIGAVTGVTEAGGIASDGTVAINVTDGPATLSGNVYGDLGVTVTADSVNATGSLNAEAGNVNVLADNGAVALAAVNAGFDVTVGASDTATLNGLITAGDDVTVNAQNAVNELGGIIADGDVTLASATSTVAVTGAIDAEGNVGIGAVTGVTEAGGIASDGAVAINVTDGAAMLSGNVYGDLGVLVNADSVNATGSLNAEAGDIVVTADNGAVALDDVSAGGDVTVTSLTANVDLNGLVSSGSSVMVTAETTLNELGGIRALVDVGLVSNTAAVNLVEAVAAGGSVTVMAETAVDEDGGISAGGMVLISADNGPADLSGDVYGDLGVMVMADSVNATGLIEAESGDVIVLADNGAVSLMEVTAGNDVYVTSATDSVTLDGLVTAGGQVDAMAWTDLSENGGIIAGGDVDLVAQNGLATLDGNVDAGGEVDVFGMDGVEIAANVTGEQGVNILGINGDVVIDGDILALAGGPIDITSVSFDVLIAQNADSTITSQDGDIAITSVEGSVLLGTGAIDGQIVTTGTGNVEISALTAFTEGASDGTIVQSGGYIDIDPATVTIAGGGLLAVGDIVVDATDQIDVNGKVESLTGNVDLRVTNNSAAAGTINIADDIIGGMVTVAVTDTTAGDATINVNGATSNVGGATLLDADNGVINIYDTVSALWSIELTATDAINLGADLYAGTSVWVDDALTLTANVNVTGVTGDVQFANTVDTDGTPYDLTVTAGDWAIFDGAVGVVNPLGDLDVQAANLIDLNANIGTAGAFGADDVTLTGLVSLGGNVHADGDITVNGDVQLYGDDRVIISDNGAVNIHGDIDQAEDSPVDVGLTVNAANGSVFLDNVGITFEPVFLTIDTPWSVLRGDIKIWGPITFQDTVNAGQNYVNLWNDVSITANSNVNDDIDFSDADINGAFDLSVTSRNGDVVFDSIGQTVALDSLTVNANDGTIQLNDAVTVTGELTLNGINGVIFNSNGLIQSGLDMMIAGGPVTLLVDTALTSLDGDVTIAESVTGDFAFDVTAPHGTVTLHDVTVDSLDAAGDSLLLAGDITTDADMNLLTTGGLITILNDVTLTTTDGNGGNVNVGDMQGEKNLTVDSDGDVTFQDAGIGSLTVIDGVNVTFFGDYATVGDVTVDTDITGVIRTEVGGSIQAGGEVTLANDSVGGIQIYGDITGAQGVSITTAQEDIDISANVRALGTGPLVLDSARRILVESLVESDTGNIDATAGTSVLFGTPGRMQSNANITITAATTGVGNIVETNPTDGANEIIGGNITLTIASGDGFIGDANGMAIEINARNSLTATTPGTGSINLWDSDDLDIINVTAANGPVSLGAAGSINARGINGAVEVDGNSIALNAGTGIGDVRRLDLASPYYWIQTLTGDINVHSDATGQGPVNVGNISSGSIGDDSHTGHGDILFTQTGGENLEIVNAATDDGDISVINDNGDFLWLNTVTAGGNGDVFAQTTTAGYIRVIGPITADASTITVDSAEYVQLYDYALNAVDGTVNVTANGLGMSGIWDPNFSIDEDITATHINLVAHGGDGVQDWISVTTRTVSSDDSGASITAFSDGLDQSIHIINYSDTDVTLNVATTGADSDIEFYQGADLVGGGDLIVQSATTALDLIWLIVQDGDMYAKQVIAGGDGSIMLDNNLPAVTTGPYVIELGEVTALDDDVAIENQAGAVTDGNGYINNITSDTLTIEALHGIDTDTDVNTYALIQTTAGDIDLDQMGDINVDVINAGNGANDVTMTVIDGSIIDATTGLVENITANWLIVDGAVNIGSGDAIETAVYGIDLSHISGNAYIDETDDVLLTAEVAGELVLTAGLTSGTGSITVIPGSLYTGGDATLIAVDDINIFGTVNVGGTFNAFAEDNITVSADVVVGAFANLWADSDALGGGTDMNGDFVQNAGSIVVNDAIWINGVNVVMADVIADGTWNMFGYDLGILVTAGTSLAITDGLIETTDNLGDIVFGVGGDVTGVTGGAFPYDVQGVLTQSSGSIIRTVGAADIVVGVVGPATFAGDIEAGDSLNAAIAGMLTLNNVTAAVGIYADTNYGVGINDIVVTGDLAAGTLDIDLDASGDIDAKFANMSAGQDVLLTADFGIKVGGLTLAGRDVTYDAGNNIEIQGDTFADEDISLTAHDGSIDVIGLMGAGGNVVFDANRVTNDANIFVYGTVHSDNGLIQFTADDDIQLWNALLGTSENGGGSITLVADVDMDGNGDIRQTGGSIESGQGVFIAGMDVTLANVTSDGLVNVGGVDYGILVMAGEDIVLNDGLIQSSATSGPIVLAAGDDVAGYFGAWGYPGNTGSVTQTSGSIIRTQGQDSVLVEANGPVTLAGYVESGDDLWADAAGAIVLNDVNAAGDILASTNYGAAPAFDITVTGDLASGSNIYLDSSAAVYVDEGSLSAANNVILLADTLISVVGNVRAGNDVTYTTADVGGVENSITVEGNTTAGNNITYTAGTEGLDDIEVRGNSVAGSNITYTSGSTIGVVGDTEASDGDIVYTAGGQIWVEGDTHAAISLTYDAVDNISVYGDTLTNGSFISYDSENGGVYVDGDTKAGTTLTYNAGANIYVDGDTDASDLISYDAFNDIEVKGDTESLNGAIAYEAGDNITVEGGTTASTTINYAGDNITVRGNTLARTQSVTYNALAAIDVTGDTEAGTFVAYDAATDITVVGHTSAGTSVALDAGDDIMVMGDTMAGTTVTYTAVSDIDAHGATMALGNITFDAGDSIYLMGGAMSETNVTFNADDDIRVEYADVAAGSGNVNLIADAELNGTGNLTMMESTIAAGNGVLLQAGRQGADSIILTDVTVSAGGNNWIRLLGGGNISLVNTELQASHVNGEIVIAAGDDLNQLAFFPYATTGTVTIDSQSVVRTNANAFVYANGNILETGLIESARNTWILAQGNITLEDINAGGVVNIDNVNVGAPVAGTDVTITGTVSGKGGGLGTAVGIQAVDDIIMENDALIEGNTGNLVLIAGGDAFLAELDAVTGNISVTATTGQIADVNNVEMNLIGNVVTLVASTGIGTANALETAAVTLTANTATANVGITESDDLILGAAGVTTGNGNVNLTVYGNLDAAANGAPIRATGGTATVTAGGVLNAGGNSRITAVNAVLTSGRGMTANTDVTNITASNTVTGNMVITEFDTTSANGLIVVAPGLGNEGDGGITVTVNTGNLTVNGPVRTEGTGNISMATLANGSNINLNAQVSSGGTVGVTAGAGGLINLNEDVDGRYNVSINSNMTVVGVANGATPVWNVSSLLGDVLFAGTINSNGAAVPAGLKATALGGKVTFMGDVGTGSRVASLDVSANRGIVVSEAAGDNVITMNAVNSVILVDDVSSSSTVATGLNISTSGAASTINLDTVGDNTPVTSLTLTVPATGVILLNGDIQVANAVPLNGDITVNGPARLVHDVDMDATGDITFNAAGGAYALGGGRQMVIDAGGNVVFNGAVIELDELTVDADLAITTTVLGTINMPGTVNFDAGTTVNINAAIGNTMPPESVTFAADDQVNLAASITAVRNILFNDEVMLLAGGGDVTSLKGDITFVEDVSGAQDLVLTAGEEDILGNLITQGTVTLNTVGLNGANPTLLDVDAKIARLNGNIWVDGNVFFAYDLTRPGTDTTILERDVTISINGAAADSEVDFLSIEGGHFLSVVATDNGNVAGVQRHNVRFLGDVTDLTGLYVASTGSTFFGENRVQYTESGVLTYIPGGITVIAGDGVTDGALDTAIDGTNHDEEIILVAGGDMVAGGSIDLRADDSVLIDGDVVVGGGSTIVIMADAEAAPDGTGDLIIGANDLATIMTTTGVRDQGSPFGDWNGRNDWAIVLGGDNIYMGGDANGIGANGGATIVTLGGGALKFFVNTNRTDQQLGLIIGYTNSVIHATGDVYVDPPDDDFVGYIRNGIDVQRTAWRHEWVDQTINCVNLYIESDLDRAYDPNEGDNDPFGNNPYGNIYICGNANVANEIILQSNLGNIYGCPNGKITTGSDAHFEGQLVGTLANPLTVNIGGTLYIYAHDHLLGISGVLNGSAEDLDVNPNTPGLVLFNGISVNHRGDMARAYHQASIQTNSALGNEVGTGIIERLREGGDFYNGGYPWDRELLDVRNQIEIYGDSLYMPYADLISDVRPCTYTEYEEQLKSQK